MFLKYRENSDLVEVIDTHELFDPFNVTVQGHFNSGEEQQEVEPFPKDSLVFPSGEELPKCWVDPNYKKAS